MKKLFIASVLALLPVLTFAHVTKDVKFRQTGEEVVSLQTFLFEKGFLQSDITGFFGKLTLQAVKSYQASVGVDQTGFVGPLTREKINSDSSMASMDVDEFKNNEDQLALTLRRVSVSMRLSSSTVSSGSSVTVSWSTRYAQGCWASGDWSGQKATSGKESSGPLTTSKTYTLTCTGSSGSATASKTVTVVATNVIPSPMPSPLPPPAPVPTPVPVPVPAPTPTQPAPMPMPMPAPAPVPPPTPTPTDTASSTIPSSTTITIWGTVDPIILGTCSSAVHDKYIIDGGDGFYYRTWHPQVDPSGCVFAHEHGMNPDTMTDSWVRTNWDPRFGYAARRMPMPGEPDGHIEAHEGYKVFVANIGDVNDEGRVNKTASLSTVHMGTGGPKRFSIQHHSNSIAYRQGNIYAATHLLLDTGGVAGVCDPRAPAPTKDALVLGTCKVNSPYEIWGMTQTIKNGTKEIYRGFATPAVFDPITVFNPANPTELVYAWDPRVATIKNFNNDWSGHRGCDRESYAQLGYFYNGNGPTEYWTDPLGNVVPQTATNAIKQTVAQSNVGGNPPFSSDIAQFKKRVSQCANISKLGLKN